MKQIKRALALLLLSVFVLSLCGCSGLTQVIGDTVNGAIGDAIGDLGDQLDLSKLLESETLRQLLGEGFSVQDLLSEGASLKDFLGEGFSVEELLGKGASLQDFFGEGFSLQELLGNGASIRSLLNGGVDLSSLLGEGVSVGELVENGVSLDALEDAGVSQEALESYLEAAEGAQTPESSPEPVEETPEPTDEPTPQPTAKPTPEPTPQPTEEPSVLEDEFYTSKEDVAEYIRLYRHLPGNFIKKNDAKKEYGWEGGGLPDHMSIGGDRFGNYEGLLPDGYTYTECDIGTMDKSSRGAKRIVFTITKTELYIYYTDDHYESFTLLYEEKA